MARLNGYVFYVLIVVIYMIYMPKRVTPSINVSGRDLEIFNDIKLYLSSKKIKISDAEIFRVALREYYEILVPEIEELKKVIEKNKQELGEELDRQITG